MQYTKLGNTGLDVSRICVGCMGFGDATRWIHQWVLKKADSRVVIKHALDIGINFFDTANVYSIGTSEEYVGRALKDFARRDEVVIATKVHGKMHDGPNGSGLSRKHIMSQIDASLRRLETDYVDLYQIHRWDYQTPIEETLEALHDVVKAGKARYIGASAMFAWQFAKALYTADLHGWTRFVSMQPHYNLIYREEEREMLPLCDDQGIAVIPYSPVAKGLLTRPPHSDAAKTLRSQNDAVQRRLYTEGDLAIAEHVAQVAEARGLPMAQIAIAWMLSKSFITAPIIGATKPHHLEDAAAAVSVQLSAAEIAQLEAAYHPHPILGYS